MRKALAIGVAGVVVAFGALQLVPYGHDHANPAPVSEPAWDSPRTRELAERACFDCHSRETKWPVYASVAPFSWAVQNHVEEGRAALDLQGGPDAFEEGEEAAEVLGEGEMPPAYYTALHPEARLTPAERRDLIAGFERTFGEGAEVGEAGGGEGDRRAARAEHERREHEEGEEE
jgi:mono/diheme cytochrome c family protein